MAEVLGVATSHSLQLIARATLVGGDTIGVQVGLQVRVRPGVKRAVLDGVGRRSEI